MPFLLGLLRLVGVELLIKVLTIFGFAAVTYVGVDAAFGALKQQFYDAYYTMPADLLAMLDLGGFKTGLSILFGAMAARIAMFATSKITVLDKL